MSAARMQEISPYTGEYFGEPVVLIFPCRNLHYSEEYYARRQGAQRDRGTSYPDPRRLGARKGGKDFHPPDGNRFPVCSPSRGNASRSIWLLGLAARGPSPFVATRHFPRTAGESAQTPRPGSLVVGTSLLRANKRVPLPENTELYWAFPESRNCPASCFAYFGRGMSGILGV